MTIFWVCNHILTLIQGPRYILSCLFTLIERCEIFSQGMVSGLQCWVNPRPVSPYFAAQLLPGGLWYSRLLITSMKLKFENLTILLANYYYK